MTDSSIAMPPMDAPRADVGAWLDAMQKRHAAPWRKITSEASAEIEMRYASATPSAHRTRSTSTATAASAVGHLNSYDRERIVLLCQDLARNNPIARSVIARKQEFTVGNGPIITSASEDAEFNAEADRLFNDCFYGHGEYETPPIEVRGLWNGVQILNAICKAWDTDGDCLLLHTGSGVQLIESLLIRSESYRSYGAKVEVKLGNSTVVGEEVDGIIVDTSGNKHLAYRLWKWDGSQVSTKFVRMQPADASTMFVSNPSADWIGAVRGEPALQALWEPITSLESFIRNTGAAAELATFFALLIKSDDAAQIQSADEAQADGSQPTSGPNHQDLYPFMLRYLKPGDSVEQIKPQFPQVGFGEFVKSMARVIGAEAAIPDAALMFDGSSLSWSNIKALMALAHARRKIEQDVLQRVVRWMRNRILPGLCEAKGIALPDDWRRCEVVFNGVPVLSLGDEVKAWTEMVNNNFATHQQACDNFNTGNTASITKTRGEEKTLMQKAGVLPQAMPGVINPNASATQPNEANQ